MDSNYMNKVLKEKVIRISEMPDDLDIILDEDFPELDDEFWEEEDG